MGGLTTVLLSILFALKHHMVMDADKKRANVDEL